MCLGLLGFTKMCLGSGRVGLNGLGSGQILGRVLTRPIPRGQSSDKPIPIVYLLQDIFNFGAGGLNSEMPYNNEFKKIL